MSSVKAHQQQENTVSKATANQSDTRGGINMPAVPVLQNKGISQLAAAEEDVLQQAPQETAQLQSEAAPVNPNNTGLPDNLKSGVEALSGVALDDVKVHYNSAKPAQLQAHAYAQGADIHVAPGQEKHLPHEAWHVVQQKQGRVQQTMQMKDTAVNDDKGLEQEADNMGTKAMQMKVDIPFKPAQRVAASGNYKIAQLLATSKPDSGPINLQDKQPAPGSGGFAVMEKTPDPEGEEVKDSVGFTGILDAATWADLGKSPRDYHRAHGYAKSFGGAGDATNVGWWSATKETEWTTYEQKVRGAGEAAIAGWTPGTGERGTYQVERQDQPQKPLKAQYLAGLVSAANWALDDARDAWTRVLQINTAKPDRYTLTSLNAMKATLRGEMSGFLQTWLNAVFGADDAETILIKKMKMTYNITTPGAGAGARREAVTKAITADIVNASSFGLIDDPEAIWAALVSHNTGAFARGGNPLGSFTKRVASSKKHDAIPLVLTPLADGWGVA